MVKFDDVIGAFLFLHEKQRESGDNRPVRFTCVLQFRFERALGDPVRASADRPDQELNLIAQLDQSRTGTEIQPGHALLAVANQRSQGVSHVQRMLGSI